MICDNEKIDKEGRYKGVPTLAVEVLSDSTRSKDMLKKLDLYKQCGVYAESVHFSGLKASLAEMFL